jgi:hypothetical protein
MSVLTHVLRLRAYSDIAPEAEPAQQHMRMASSETNIVSLL